MSKRRSCFRSLSSNPLRFPSLAAATAAFAFLACGDGAQNSTSGEESRDPNEPGTQENASPDATTTPSSDAGTSRSDASDATDASGADAARDGSSPDTGGSTNDAAIDEDTDSGVSPNCPFGAPTTLYPGAPVSFVRAASGPMTTGIGWTRILEKPNGFLDTRFIVNISGCARLSSTMALTMGIYRVPTDRTGEPTRASTLTDFFPHDPQGSGFLATTFNRFEVALFATTDAPQPVWRKSLPLASDAVEPGNVAAVRDGGFVAALWNYNSSSEFRWDALTIPARDSNFYVVRADSSGRVLWSHSLNAFVSLRAANDRGMSVFDVSLSSPASPSDISLNSTRIIPAADAPKCNLVFLNANGTLARVKTVTSCGDAMTSYAFDPTSMDLYALSRATVDWGTGAFSSNNNEFTLTKIGASGVVWRRSVFAYPYPSFAPPKVIVGANGVPIVIARTNGTVSFAGKTLGGSGASLPIFAFHTDGRDRWLTGLANCTESPNVTSFGRAHDRVAIAVNGVRACRLENVTLGAVPSGPAPSEAAHLLVLEP